MGIAGPSRCSSDIEPDVDLMRRDWALELLFRRLRVPPILTGPLFLCGYWAAPLVAAACAGVLVSDTSVNTQFAPLGLTAVGTWLSRDSLDVTPYLRDITHLLMAGTVAVGASLIAVILDRFHVVYAELSKPGLLQIPESFVSVEARRLAGLASSRVVRGVLLIVSLACLGVFLMKTVDPTAAGWWGHRTHGIAGVVLAASIWAMVYFGGLVVWLLVVGLNSISRLFEFPVTLRPFHPDGCNGFGHFGNFLILLVLAATSIVGAIWITFGRGYLGIEKFFGVWLAALGLTAALPVIVVSPLAKATRRIHSARFVRLARLEHALQSVLIRFESRIEEAGVETDQILDELKGLTDGRKALQEIYGTNIFPFNPKIVGTVGISYVVQAVAVIREILSKIGG